ncbi:hypothetical protein R6Q57_008177 [Mikania cordata]
MAKAISKKGSRGRIRKRKSIRKIPKGVIHIQASFNNSILTVTDVRGRVVSWSSTGTCGFRGTRRGTPFAAQTAGANAIRAVEDQGMQRAKVMKNVTDSFVSLGHWPSIGSFGFNTDILATNLINLSAVLGVLIFFGKEVCASCLFQEKAGSNQMYFSVITSKVISKQEECMISRITSE